MSKRTVSVTLPHRQPEELLRLAQRIMEKSATNEEVSPIAQSDLAELELLATEAETNRTRSIHLREESEKDMQAARIALGIEKGQTASNPNTLTYLVSKMRDVLLAHYRGKEEQLSEYGFKVVTNSFSPKGRSIKIVKE
ncbi:MAG: hypothetical protein ABI199_05850 [Bacteroidia bacterium]